MPTLSIKDQKLLNRLDLPTNHKAYLEELWAESSSPPAKRTLSSIVVNVLVRFILPAMCIVLMAHLLYPELAIAPFLRLVYFLVLAMAFLGVSLNGLMILGLYGAAGNPQNLRKILASTAGRGTVLFLVRRTLWGKTVIWLNVFLTMLLIMVGGVGAFIAIVYLVAWISMLILHQVGKGATQRAIAALYDHDQIQVDRMKNVTPRQG